MREIVEGLDCGSSIADERSRSRSVRFWAWGWDGKGNARSWVSSLVSVCVGLRGGWYGGDRVSHLSVCCRSRLRVGLLDLSGLLVCVRWCRTWSLMKKGGFEMRIFICVYGMRWNGGVRLGIIQGKRRHSNTPSFPQVG